MFNFLELAVMDLCDIYVNNHPLYERTDSHWLSLADILSESLIMSRKGNIFCYKGVRTSQCSP